MATLKTARRSLRAGMLFALPFAAVGVGALVWGVADVLAWQRMRTWTPVSAHVLAVELEEHDDGDSTTYETTATYRYDYAGRQHTGSRVAISSGADNVGAFQQRLYSELSAAHASGRPVTAYVDPSNPSAAVLNRELRWGLLTFKGVFMLAFGGIGFGLLFGARHSGKKLAAEDTLRARHPNEPWRWRPEWANGHIASSARTTAYAATAFALVWNLVSLPAAIFVPGEIASGNRLAAIALLFPLVGAGLAAWAVRAWLQLRRFKVATLTLDRTPAALGGRLKGSIRVAAEIPIVGDFRLELACSEQRVEGSGKNRERNERLLWQKEWRVPRHQCQIASAFSSIPVDVALPADQPGTTMSEEMPQVSWRLEVTGECPGPDFWSRFEVPVFDVGERPAANAPPSPALATSAAPASLVQPDAGALAALGIRYERLPQGGEAWTFVRGHHKTVAVAITVFAAIWTTASTALFFMDAPLLIPVAFALFDALFVWWALSLWFTEHRVTLERGLLTLTRRGFMARAPIEIPLQWIRSVRPQRGMQAGNKLYYDLQVETGEDTYTAAISLADFDIASSLARHWMTGGAPRRSRESVGG